MTLTACLVSHLACFLLPAVFLPLCCEQPLSYIDMFWLSICLTRIWTLTCLFHSLFFFSLLTLQVETVDKLVYFYISLFFFIFFLHIRGPVWILFACAPSKVSFTQYSSWPFCLQTKQHVPGNSQRLHAFNGCDLIWIFLWVIFEEEQHIWTDN